MCGKRDESYATEGLVFPRSDDGTYYYSVTDDIGFAMEVYISSVRNGLLVTSIENFAFYNCTGLTGAVFENPNGWRAGGTDLSASLLSTPATAARYLHSIYCCYFWTRQ